MRPDLEWTKVTGCDRVTEWPEMGKVNQMAKCGPELKIFFMTYSRISNNHLSFPIATLCLFSFID